MSPDKKTTGAGGATTKGKVSDDKNSRSSQSGESDKHQGRPVLE
jgi:hypothetical protein